MLEFKQNVASEVEKLDKVEALKRESASMRLIGTWASLLTIVATLVLARFSDAEWAALAGGIGVLVAGGTLAKKLIDDRALAQKLGDRSRQTSETI
jgi:hypothetical protein